MLGSHRLLHKQQPYDESIRVPLLFRSPGGSKTVPRNIETPISSEDLMPTILGLCGIARPKTVQGLDFSEGILGKKPPPDDGGAVIMCVAPFGEWDRRRGGHE